jgi:phosphoglycolate phosphatase
MTDEHWWGDYEAVLFDLDGTLVRLAVDWRAVEVEIGAVLADSDLDPDAYSAWELLDAAESVGRRDAVDAVIADHELAGAEDCERLPLADVVPAIDVPVGVVSLNAVGAVRLALERESLIEHVAVVLGRDSTDERKPHPEPLLAAVEALGVEPAAAIFVGDSESDAEAARRAGMDFRAVEE